MLLQTYFGINVFIPLFEQSKSGKSLLSIEPKDFECCFEGVAGFLNYVNDAKALSNGNVIPSKILEGL